MKGQWKHIIQDILEIKNEKYINMLDEYANNHYSYEQMLPKTDVVRKTTLALALTILSKVNLDKVVFINENINEIELLNKDGDTTYYEKTLEHIRNKINNNKNKIEIGNCLITDVINKKDNLTIKGQLREIK